MTPNIHFIELTFENLDHIKIPAHYFRDFELADGPESSGSYAVAFTLKPEANADFTTFDADIHSVEVGDETLFDRLQRNDITHIGLDHGSGPEERLPVIWEDADSLGYTNRLQSVAVNCDGALYVRIGTD